MDESGDPGFQISAGSSPCFVATMVVFQDATSAFATQRVIEQSDARRLHKGEFKFSKVRDDIREMFFRAVRDCQFSVHAIVVNKESAHSKRLISEKVQLYEFFVGSMLNYNSEILKNAKITIDGSGEKAFRRKLEANLKRSLQSGAIAKVVFKDSKKDTLVQLADMCAGAIARSFRRDRRDAQRCRDILAPRIESIWEF